MKSIVLALLLVGYACSNLQAIDSDDFRRYGKIGLSMGCIGVGVAFSIFAQDAYSTAHDQKKLESIITGHGPYNGKESENPDNKGIQEKYKSDLKCLTKAFGAVSAVFLVSGACGLSKSFK